MADGYSLIDGYGLGQVMLESGTSLNLSEDDENRRRLLSTLSLYQLSCSDPC